MKIQPYIDKLSASKEFKDFQKENKDSFPIAGFFILDLEQKKNVHQIDYYMPDKNKVAAFNLDEDIKIQIMDMVSKKAPEQLDLKTEIDLDALEGILEDEMKNRNMSESVKKIIAILQNLDGKKIWNLNCVLSGLEILRAHIEDSSKTVLKMEKISMMDLVKKIPKSAMQPPSKNLKGKEPSPEIIKKEIKNLDKMEKELEKEKHKLEKMLNEDLKKAREKQAKTEEKKN